MTRQVTVVDYGLGNLFSIHRALESAGGSVTMADDPAGVARADRLVLPGVGAFPIGMRGLRDRGLVEPILSHAAAGRPVLGICLGMQLLGTSSEEFGGDTGLGLIDGKVVPVPDRGRNGTPHRLPHVGWAAIRPTGEGTWRGSPLADTPDGTHVYFVHSFHMRVADPAQGLAVTEYNGAPLTAAVRRGPVTGFQFHPEKSAHKGLNMLDAFLHL